MIRERSGLDAIASEIRASDQAVALDLETYGTSEDKKIKRDEALDSWRGEVRLLSLRLPDRVPWLIDLNATSYGLGELGKVLEAAEIIGHNMKFDALWLARKCNAHLVKMIDTSSASRILSNGDPKLGNRLGEVADRYLGIELRKDRGRSDWGSPILLAEQIQYAAQDVEHLQSLKEKLDAELNAAGLMGIFRLEMDLLPVVVEMELIGFCVDRKKLEELAAEAARKRDQTAQTVKQALWKTRAQPRRSRSAPGGLAKPRDCSQEYEREFFIGMPASGCRRYPGVQEMEEAQRGCRVSHPRNPARRPNSCRV